MSLTNSSEYNALGGGFSGGLGGGFGGGFGGIAPFGLLGLLGIGDITGHKKDTDCNGQAVLLAAIGNAKDTSVSEARGIATAICEAEKQNMNSFYAQAIQAERNTAQLSAQAQAIAALTDKRLDDIASAGTAQTAAILAKINQTEIDALRDQLAHSHRRGDSQDINIAISNSNAQLQAQLQAQAQVQSQRDFDHIRRFDTVFSQVAKAGQDIINVGGLMAGVAQTANPVNVKS